MHRKIHAFSSIIQKKMLFADRPIKLFCCEQDEAMRGGGARAIKKSRIEEQ